MTEDIYLLVFSPTPKFSTRSLRSAEAAMPLAAILNSIAANPSLCCKAYFLTSAGGILAVAFLHSDIRRALVDYGSRATTSEGRKPESQYASTTAVAGLVRKITAWGRVPHSWFISFYVTSTLCSLLWAVQYVLAGDLLRQITVREAAVAHGSMSLAQAVTTWALLACHGTRRLLEQLLIVKPSTSDMGLVHWLFGISFYLVMSVAIWVEGAGRHWREPRTRERI
jgi:3-oxo-5-alpha-steroid 4-dehydrogenase 3